VRHVHFYVPVTVVMNWWGPKLNDSTIFTVTHNVMYNRNSLFHHRYKMPRRQNGNEICRMTKITRNLHVISEDPYVAVRINFYPREEYTTVLLSIRSLASLAYSGSLAEFTYKYYGVLFCEAGCCQWVKYYICSAFYFLLSLLSLLNITIAFLHYFPSCTTLQSGLRVRERCIKYWNIWIR
jgi:hypothetical protein